MKRYSEIKEGDLFYIVSDYVLHVVVAFIPADNAIQEDTEEAIEVIYKYRKGEENCLRCYRLTTEEEESFDPQDTAPIGNFLKITPDPLVCISLEEAKGALGN